MVPGNTSRVVERWEENKGSQKRVFHRAVYHLGQLTLYPTRNSENQFRTHTWGFSHTRGETAGFCKPSPMSRAEGCCWGLVRGTCSCPVCRDSWLWQTESQVKGIWKSGQPVTVKVCSPQIVVNISFQLLPISLSQHGSLHWWLPSLLCNSAVVSLLMFPLQLTDSVEFRLPKERNWLAS